MTHTMAEPVSSSSPASAAPNPARQTASLLRKYRQPAPRYTSYPTANHFNDDLAALDVPRLIADDNRHNPAPAPLSLYFHLPFCQSRCWFCGCTNIVTTRRAAAAEYLAELAAEIALVAPLLDPRRVVTQLHLGGGTPTFFPHEQLLRFAETVHDQFVLAPDAEISVEIDPRHLDSSQILALRILGARRASIGVQDTNPEVQAAVHRVQPHALNHRSKQR